MTPEQEQYDRRKAEQKARYKQQILERCFGWWRNPTDRFAGLVAAFTAALFVATAGLWIATKDLVNDAKASGRAWIGPTNASLTVLEPTKGVKGTIIYRNTGKEPAPTKFLHIMRLFSINDWTNGNAAKEIIANKNGCLKINDVGSEAHITYPTTTDGNGFTVVFDSALATNIPNSLFVATEGLKTGGEIFVMQGCMIYRAVEHVRHSAFCYFYKSPDTDMQHLSYCNVGQAAD